MKMTRAMGVYKPFYLHPLETHRCFSACIYDINKTKSDDHFAIKLFVRAPFFGRPTPLLYYACSFNSFFLWSKLPYKVWFIITHMWVT